MKGLEKAERKTIMKKMKKLAALFLAVVMVMAMGMTAMAAPQTIETGKGGSASITIKNPKIGKTYTVYKVFDATETGTGTEARIAYTLRSTQTKADLADTGFTADANGNVTAVNKDQKELTPEQAEKIQELAVKTGEQIGETVTSDGTELVFEGLEFGYYVVVSSVGAAVTIDSTTPDMVIYDKNPSGPTPDPDQKVKQADNDLVQVGGTANYTVRFITANYETKEIEDDPATDEIESGSVTTKIYEYTIKDTVEGSFLDNLTVDSVTVYANDEDTVGEEISPRPSFVNNVMTINWTEDGTENGAHLYNDGAILEIKYHGTVNKNIKDGQSGNTNKVEIGWNGSTTTIPGEDDVYTASITIDKVNGATGDKLAGATFVLLDKAVGEDGVIPDDAKYYMADETDGRVTADDVSKILVNGAYHWPETAKVRTDDNGMAKFSGLKPEGPYFLLEIEAPAGFNRLVKTTPITIEPIKTNGTDAEIAESITKLNVTQTIENNAGAVLPSTGGIGTTIFYVVGGILVLGAAVLLITKKRMSARN